MVPSMCLFCLHPTSISTLTIAHLVLLLSHVRPFRPHGLQPTRIPIHSISQARIMSALPFASPVDLPDPRIELVSPPWQVDSCAYL